MPGNSQRRGATSKGKGNTAGSGGRIRRSLEGRGATPRAEDRPYHKAYKGTGPAAGRGKAGSDSVGRSRSAPEAAGRGRSTPEPAGRGRSTPEAAGRGRATGDSRGRGRADTTERRPSPRRSAPPRAGRPAAGPEWVAGRNPVLEALEAGLPVRTAYVADGAERDDRLRDILRIAAERGFPMLQATRAELDRLTGGTFHQGVALQLPAYDYLHPDDLLARALDVDEPLVVALDSINDPRNLGAIVRSAAAFGADGVIIPERRSASMTASAWKTSAGAAARLPIARATNLNRTLKAYADAGFTVIGLAGEADLDIRDVPGMEGPMVLVVGSEGEGLARLVRENCDVLVRIPITNRVESLNAGVAAAIALYEISRRRA